MSKKIWYYNGICIRTSENPFKVLKRYKNFESNGKLFIGVPNAKSLNRRIGLSLGKIQNIYDLNENDIKLGQRQFCLDKLSDCVKKSGYKIINKEGLYLKPLPLSFLKLDNLKKLAGYDGDWSKLSWFISWYFTRSSYW